MKITFITPIASLPRLNATRKIMSHLKETIDSMLSQTVPYWEYLIVCDEKLYTKDLESFCNYYQNIGYPIKVITNPSPNAVDAANTGLRYSTGKYIALIYPGDIIAPYYTFLLIKAILENKKVKFIYPDQDYISNHRIRHSPYIKPEISPDLLMCHDYIGSVSVIKKTLLNSLGGWDHNFKNSYCYALNLKIIETCLKIDCPDLNFRRTKSKIFHLNQILYSQRILKSELLETNRQDNQAPEQKKSFSPATKKENIKILADFIDRNNLPIKEIKVIKNRYLRHNWSFKNQSAPPLASIIIPTRNGYQILKKCIDSITKKTNYSNYEIIIIDNDSNDLRTLEYLDSICKNPKIRKINYPGAFNFSEMNNYAVSNSKGSIIIFLNNDTEIISKDWLYEFVTNASRGEIGCVGALLYYPDKTIQHAGAIVGMHGVADHAFKAVKKNKSSNYFGYFDCSTNPNAVTAAAMAIKKELFTKLGGFDSRHLKIAFNDTDLCLKAQEKGYRNLLIPYVELVHHESKTRAPNDLQSEKDYFRKRWVIPYGYNPNNKIINYP